MGVSDEKRRRSSFEQVGEGMSSLARTSCGEKRIPGWHRTGNQEGLGEVNRGHRINTVDFVPVWERAMRRRFSLACSPLPLNHPRTSGRRGGEGRKEGQHFVVNLQASHTLVLSQNEKIT